MAVTKRDLEIAALKWKVCAESAQQHEEEMAHALNLLVNDAVDWFAQHQTSDGTIHEFGIGIALEVPIKDSVTRVIRGADVENLPVVLWKSTLPNAKKSLYASGPDRFKGLIDVVLKHCGDPHVREEMIRLIESISREIDSACERYMASREHPVIH